MITVGLRLGLGLGLGLGSVGLGSDWIRVKDMVRCAACCIQTAG